MLQWFHRSGVYPDGGGLVSDTMRPELNLGDDLAENESISVHREIAEADFSFMEIEPGTEAFISLSRSLDGRPRSYRVLKRSIDVLVSLSVIAVGLIPGLILSLLIWFDTGRGASPIYTQTRAGRFGIPFRIHKFRTMVADSDNVEKYLNEEDLSIWYKERKVENDPRITNLGRLLRATSIDELPNFLDVLAGNLSIVGPRAISYSELAWFENQQAELLSVQPGITGLWQTGPRNEASFESGRRQAIELEYIRTASMRIDARLFFRTFGAVFGRTGK